MKSLYADLEADSIKLINALDSFAVSYYIDLLLKQTPMVICKSLFIKLINTLDLFVMSYYIELSW